ncbi:hypothetical protein ABID26_006298 [Mesorhizobium shonense]|uniref:Uncharacterized protein n=1 Tax=Mesorhizobium shonense TaxID=1209948 RepID=A0ABV2I2P2_9HYPH
MLNPKRSFFLLVNPTRSCVRPRVAEWERAEISSFMSMNSALFSARL